MRTYIVIVTKKGKAIKFNTKELAKSHPEGQDVKVADLDQGDQVVSAFSVQEE